MKDTAIAIIANDGYLAAYGLKEMLRNNTPCTIAMFDSVVEFSKCQDEFSVVFSFLPVAGIKSIVIDSKASKEQLHQAVSQAFSHIKEKPSIVSAPPKEEASVLSKRELEVLKLVASGLINKEIAERMNISLQTVLSHRKHISAKLGIRTTSGFTAYAMINGLV